MGLPGAMTDETRENGTNMLVVWKGFISLGGSGVFFRTSGGMLVVLTSLATYVAKSSSL